MAEETQAQVQKVAVTVQVPKEMNDVKNLVVELIRDIKAKKTPGELVAENIPGLMSAMDGMDKLGAEAQDAAAYDLAALLAADIAKILTGKA
jgi:hypothetical protein